MTGNSIQTIFWDFDGVILDSVPVRDEGYRQVLSHYPDQQVEQLMRFQRINGGLSRYVKFRYFYEEILGREITDGKIRELAGKYSDYMVQKLRDRSLLIDETMEFIHAHQDLFTMHIVSGSDQDELRYLCKELQIDHFFRSIHGSPVPKKKLVEKVMDDNNYHHEHAILIGDSINDYEAAKVNKVKFFGYNNRSLIGKGEGYITSFKEVPFGRA